MVYLFSRHDNSTFKTQLTEGMLHSILVTDPLPCTAISSLGFFISAVLLIVTVDLLLMLRTIPPISKIRTARITARSFWFLWHKYHLQYKSRCRFSHNGSLIFRFCQFNIITEAYCIELDFTVLFPESLFHQAHSCEGGIRCRYRTQAQSQFPPSAYRTDISTPILSEAPYSPRL